MTDAVVFEELAASQEKFDKEAGRAFIAAPPGPTAGFLDHWDLHVTGAPMHGVSALVLPSTARTAHRPY